MGIAEEVARTHMNVGSWRPVSRSVASARRPRGILLVAVLAVALALPGCAGTSQPRSVGRRLDSSPPRFRQGLAPAVRRVGQPGAFRESQGRSERIDTGERDRVAVLGRAGHGPRSLSGRHDRRPPRRESGRAPRRRLRCGAAQSCLATSRASRSSRSRTRGALEMSSLRRRGRRPTFSSSGRTWIPSRRPRGQTTPRRASEPCCRWPRHCRTSSQWPRSSSPSSAPRRSSAPT